MEHGTSCGWLAWSGSAGTARAKILGTADGYTVASVEAQPGYRGHLTCTRTGAAYVVIFPI